MTEDQIKILDLINLWVEGFVMVSFHDVCTIKLSMILSQTVIGTLGFIGNSLAIFVLTSSEVRNSFNLMLACLATFDNIFILITLLDYGLIKNYLWPLDYGNNTYALLFPKFLYPLNSIFLTSSILLTLSIAYERFLYISNLIFGLDR